MRAFFTQVCTFYIQKISSLEEIFYLRNIQIFMCL